MQEVEAPAVPAWRMLTLLGLAVVGFGISVYLTVAHYEDVPLACTTTSLINCASVTSSSYSLVGSTALPISLLGLVWFWLIGGSALAVLLKPPRSISPLVAQFGLSTGGLGYVLYLVYIELVRLNRICEWCTVVHLLTVVIFVLALSNLQTATARR